jgi:hypothetical protein
MEETLKAVRLLHQVIVVLSAALLAFAISPDERPRIEAALKELEALRNANHVGIYEALYQETSRFDGNGTPEKIKSFCQTKLGVPAAASFRFHPVFHVEEGIPDEKTAPLRSWQEFLTESIYVGTIIPADLNELEAELERQKVRGGLAEQAPAKPEIFEVRVQLPEDEQLFPNSRFPARLFLDDKADLPPAVAKSWPPYGTFYSGSIMVDFDLHGSSLRYQNLMVRLRTDYRAPCPAGKAWLKAIPSLAAILQPNGKDTLPATHRYWGECAPLTITEATNTLTKRLESAPKTVTFSGITIETSLLIWVAPLVTLVFVAYIAVHLRHLSRLTERKTALLRDFPWIGLFEDRVSIVLLGLTLFALPTVANIAVILRSLEGAGWVLFLGLGLFLILLAMQGAMLMTLRKLHCRIRQAEATRAIRKKAKRVAGE